MVNVVEMGSNNTNIERSSRLSGGGLDFGSGRVNSQNNSHLGEQSSPNNGSTNGMIMLHHTLDQEWVGPSKVIVHLKMNQRSPCHDILGVSTTYVVLWKVRFGEKGYRVVHNIPVGRMRSNNSRRPRRNR